MADKNSFFERASASSEDFGEALALSKHGAEVATGRPGVCSVLFAGYI